MRTGDLSGASDHDLVKAFAGGDQNAVEELLRRHQNRVYGLAFRLLGNRPDALDATQEVFVTLLRKARTFRAESAFSTWLYRVTANACYDIQRRHSREPQGIKVPELPVPDRTSSVESRMVVEEALAGLPQDQRTALVLREINDLPYEEIADVTGVAIGTVKSRIARARAALVEALTGGEPPSAPARLNDRDR